MVRHSTRLGGSQKLHMRLAAAKERRISSALILLPVYVISRGKVRLDASIGGLITNGTRNKLFLENQVKYGVGKQALIIINRTSRW